MKKLFSLALVIVALFAITGCSTEDLQALQDQVTNLTGDLADLQDDLDTKVAEITTLQGDLQAKLEEVTGLQSDKEDLEDEIARLEAELAELQAQIFDNVITFRLEFEDGTYENKTVGYNDDFAGTLFDLLDATYDVQYTDSDYGKMINGIDDMTTMAGNYIAFYKNNEMSMVGVEGATFEDADIFSFEISWWDMDAKAVYDAINLFVENQANNYVNDTKADIYVLQALETLGVTEEFATDAELTALVDVSSLATLGDYYKASYILDAAGMPTTPTITLLNDNVASAMSWDYWYALQTLNTFDNTVSNFTTFETTVLDYFNTTTPTILGVDSGAMALIALSEYDTTEANALVAEYATWIKTDQLETGGFKTRDSEWGGTVYPGTENAASMSTIIIGFVANGINPAGTDYTQGDNTLVSRLLEFQNEDGSFDYLYGDENADLMFSTPQAFLALVAYQEYINSGYQAYNPFS